MLISETLFPAFDAYINCFRAVRFRFIAHGHSFGQSLPPQFGTIIRGCLGRILQDKAQTNYPIWSLIYHTLFSQDATPDFYPKPFALYVEPLDNYHVQIDFCLFGLACDWHPYVYQALCEIFIEPLRFKQYRFPLRTKSHHASEILLKYPCYQAIDSLRIALLSPLCLKTDNAYAGSFKNFLRNIILRLSRMAYYHTIDIDHEINQLYQEIDHIRIKTYTKPISWLHHSSRIPKKSYPIIGHIGDIVLQGHISEILWHILHLGELIQAGSYTNFGLGKYQICYDDFERGSSRV